MQQADDFAFDTVGYDVQSFNTFSSLNDSTL
jgi:hypothetical protein